MLESSIEAKCVKWAERAGWEAIKIYQRRSYPDRVFVSPDYPSIFVEFKAPGEEPRPDQKRTIKKLTQKGFTVFSCDNYEDFVNAMRHEMSCHS